MVYNIFRRYQQAIMISVTIVTIITFAGFYSRSDFLDKSGVGRIAVIYGRGISLPQAQRAARRADLCLQLAQMEMYSPGGERKMTELYESLALNQQDAKKNFMWNGMVLRHEAGILGVEPTEDEVFDATKALPMFQTNGAYDSNKFNMISAMVLDHRGFTANDLGDLVGDALRLTRIKNLLGATVAPSEVEIRELYTRLNQKTEASVVRFKFDDFLAAANVTDEDVKKLYEERKETLKTEEKRKVKYAAFVLPTTDKPLQGKDRADALTELQAKAEKFSVAMTEKGANFDEEAAKAGAKVEQSPEFTIAQPPAELESSREIAAAVFKLNAQEPTSDLIETPRGYYVLQLTGVTQPRPLTLDEAKADLTGMLKHERAQEALNLKATDVRNKIEAEVKGGKAFAAAAEAAGVKAQEVPAFSQVDHTKAGEVLSPKDPSGAGEVFQTAFELKEGQISTVLPSADGSLIVYVSKRLPIDEKEFQAGKAPLASGIANFQRKALFQQWIKLRRAAAQLSTTFQG